MKFFKLSLFSLCISLLASSCSNGQEASTPTAASTTEIETNKMMTNKEKTIALLNSLETGAKEPVGYINAESYTQHNLGVGDGLAGFGAVLQHAPPEGFKVNVIRAFEDGDFVVTHTEYDFFGPKVGFDIFRFENGLIVEHWDNLTAITPPNPSGRTQFDGATEVTDLDKTDANKALVQGFIDDILMNGKTDKLTDYVSTETYLQHNSSVADGLDGLGAAFKYMAENNLVMTYEKNHKILAQGNFVLSVCEGKFGKGDHVSFYDLFRIENDKIVEHWDIIETIAPKSTWKNENGKFGF